MKLVRHLIRLFFVACSFCPTLAAQDTQFLPEVDAYLTVNSHVRVFNQALDDRAGGDPQQLTFGSSIQFYAKPLLKLKRVTTFDLDDSKSRPLGLESGWGILKSDAKMDGFGR